MSDSPVPPQSLEAEESVLGACLTSSNAIAACQDEVDPADFYYARNGQLYATILELDAAGAPVDILTLQAELERQGLIEQVGGHLRLRELAILTPATANAAAHARMVKDAALRRNLIAAGTEVARLGWEAAEETPLLVDRAEQLVYRVRADRGQQTSTAETVAETMRVLQRLRDNPQELLGAASGFPDLDRVTQGFQPGSMAILAARPSMGKTALAVGIAARIAVSNKQPVEFFSLEMSRSEIVQRLLSQIAKVDLQRLRNPRACTDEEWARVAEVANALAQAPLEIDDSGTLRPMELRSRVRRAKQRRPDLALVFVDYLQLMAADKPRDSKTQEVTEISRALKVMARDLDVSVLALAQLNRSLEARPDKRPILSDLRDSGALEQDADLVMFLYRDEVYRPDTEHAGVAELHVAKHRNGPTDTIRLQFRKETAKFSSLHLRSVGVDVGAVA